MRNCNRSQIAAAPARPFRVHLIERTAACGLVWATLRRDSAGRAWMLAGAAMVIVGAFAAIAQAERATNSATPVSVGSATWVDDAVPAGASVAVVWDERRGGGGGAGPPGAGGGGGGG